MISQWRSCCSTHTIWSVEKAHIMEWNQMQHKLWSKSWVIRRSVMVSPYEYRQYLKLGRAKIGCYDQAYSPYWKGDSNSFLKHQRTRPRPCSLTCKLQCPQYWNPHHLHRWKSQNYRKVIFMTCMNSHFMQLRKTQVQCLWMTQMRNRQLWKQHPQLMR